MNKKPLICLRCRRTLEMHEMRCKICAAADRIQIDAAQGVPTGSPFDVNSATDPSMTTSDKIFGVLGILIFCVVLMMMALSFIRELIVGGLWSAIKNQSGILYVVGVFLLIWLLASRSELERIGFGVVHRILRLAVIVIFMASFLYVFLTIFDGFFDSASLGMPDNIRY